MCYTRSRESLYSFGIKDLQSGLRKEGYPFRKLEEETLLRGGSVTAQYSKSRTNQWGEVVGTFSFEVVIRRDSEGLYLETYSGGRLLGERFRLVKRESNLKTGTYRYYILDPYSPPGKETLCEKLYYLPGLCEFVSPAILRSWRVLYTQQRQGKLQRYYFPVKTLPSTKHRKTHYRGKITPFWEKYQRDSEERDYRLLEYETAQGFAEGLISPDLERGVKEEYCRRTGRKTLPKPYYYTPRRSWRR